MWISTASDGTTFMFCRHWCATLAGASYPTLSAPVESIARRNSCAHCAHCGWVVGAAYDRRCWVHDDKDGGCPARRPELMLTMATAAALLVGQLSSESIVPLLVGVEAQLNETADVHRYATPHQLVAAALERSQDQAHNDARPQ